MVESIAKRPYVPRNQLQNFRMYQGKPPIRMWRRMKRLLQAHSLVLEAEKMEIRSPPVTRSYRSNKTVEQHQQPPIEEPSTQEDSSLIDLPATNNPPIPLISSLKEEVPKFICNRGKFSVESKETTQGFVLFDNDEVTPSTDSRGGKPIIGGVQRSCS